jgi:hypothetical protein
VVEHHRLFALVNERVVENIQHFEERGVGRDVANGVVLKCSRLLGILLTPYFEFQFHRFVFHGI